jgi:hypothetical protein
VGSRQLQRGSGLSIQSPQTILRSCRKGGQQNKVLSSHLSDLRITRVRLYRCSLCPLDTTNPMRKGLHIMSLPCLRCVGMRTLLPVINRLAILVQERTFETTRLIHVCRPQKAVPNAISLLLSPLTPSICSVMRHMP